MIKNTENLISLPLERNVLSGLVKFPEIFAEVDSYLNEFDFFNKVHQTVYVIIKGCYLKQEHLDRVVLGQKMINLGLSLMEEIDIVSYIDNLYYSQINNKGAFESIKELIKLRIKRDLVKTADDIKGYVIKSGNVEINEMIGTADAIYNNKISAFDLNDGPVHIFKDAEQIIEQLGENPTEEMGIPSPYPNRNLLYGNYRGGGVYGVVSRSGQGKSQYLSSTGIQIALQQNIPFLLCDSEMNMVDVRFRLIASLTDVPMYYIESGLWRKNKEMTDKIRKVLPKLNSIPFYHIHVGNKDMNEVCSIMRKFKYGKIGRHNKSVLCYDYFKLTDDLRGGMTETQNIGLKVNLFKELLEQLNIKNAETVGLAAMQQNRTGEAMNKKSADIIEDSSTISSSDKFLWACNELMLFRAKSTDELERDSINFGTHKSVCLKSRFKGKESSAPEYIKRRESKEDKKGKYIRHYINYDVRNFNVAEKGSVTDIIRWEKDQFDVQAVAGEEALL